jgi:hypothetical protein
MGGIDPSLNRVEGATLREPYDMRKEVPVASPTANGEMVEAVIPSCDGSTGA